MSKARATREKKRQLGQFLTPAETARRLVDDLPLDQNTTVLEPSFGDGSFILPLVERFMGLYKGPVPDRLEAVLNRNVFGIEIDEVMYTRCLEKLRSQWGPLPKHHNLVRADFFRRTFRTEDLRTDLFGGRFADHRSFEIIIGNPPFGGTIKRSLQDKLDKEFGYRHGLKIKKETYSFFIVKCTDLLAQGGLLRFICSDTFLTIPTMKGLRWFLMNQGQARVEELDRFSDETNQPMVVLDFIRGERSRVVVVNNRDLPRATIELTGNYSWRIEKNIAPYFSGPKLGDFVVGSGGMTIGNNDLFIRPIVDGGIEEPFGFEFFEDPITLERELERARLGYLSRAKQAEIRALERRGATRRNVRAIRFASPRHIKLPHSDYLPYNKSSNAIVYAPPKHVVFWRNDGDAVLTFKRNGNWYLHGVGGKPYFKREGLTWQLISPRLNCRYLPSGCILDSGAPCAFLRQGIPMEELYFILGWALSPLCERLLKGTLNHTRNIQGKDFERLPYPFWVEPDEKRKVIRQIRAMVREGIAGRTFSREDPEVGRVGEAFEASPMALRTERQQLLVGGSI